jgi:AbiV family abortive infection protein
MYQLPKVSAMKIPNEEFAKGVKLCFRNASRLIDNAVLLFKKESYGYSFFLIVTAIEEISKAFMYSCGRIDIWKEKELDSDIKNHLQKYALFVFAIFTDSFMRSFNRAIQTREHKIIKPVKLDDFKELRNDMDSAVIEIWNSRLQGLYVDYRQGKWLSPFDIERKDVIDLLKYAKNYKRMMKAQCANILKATPDMARQIQEYFDNELLPALSTQLKNNANWAYKNGYIDEKLYKKILTAEIKS